MREKRKITPTKKKVSKETQAMAVRKAGDKGYTKGFEAGKLESTDTIKELQSQVRHTYDARLDDRKVLDKAVKIANKEVTFWQVLTGLSVAFATTLVASSVLG